MKIYVNSIETMTWKFSFLLNEFKFTENSTNQKDCPRKFQQSERLSQKKRGFYNRPRHEMYYNSL